MDPASLSWIVLTAVIVVWAAIALGITWGSFARLQIDSASEFDYEYGYYRIKIINKSYKEVTTKAAVDRIEGMVDPERSGQSDLPLELCWKHYHDIDPSIPAKGTRYVDVVKRSTSDVAIPAKRHELRIMKAGSNGRVRIRLSVWGTEPHTRTESRWFLVTWDGTSGGIVRIQTEEEPPSSEMPSILKWLGSLSDGWNRVTEAAWHLWRAFRAPPRVPRRGPQGAAGRPYGPSVQE